MFNFLVFLVFGIPLLVLAQFTDAFYFLRHTYTLKQRQIVDKQYFHQISLAHFEEIITWLDKLIA